MYNLYILCIYLVYICMSVYNSERKIHKVQLKTIGNSMNLNKYNNAVSINLLSNYTDSYRSILSHVVYIFSYNFYNLNPRVDIHINYNFFEIIKSLNSLYKNTIFTSINELTNSIDTFQNSLIVT